MNDNEIIFEYHNYPVIPVKFKYKDMKTPVIEALVDSGGDFIVIPMPIATYLKMDLDIASDIDTAGGITCMYKTNIDIVIGRKERCMYYNGREIHVSSNPDIPVLLGRNPLFDDYEITFKKYKKQLILKPLKGSVYSEYPAGF